MQKSSFFHNFTLNPLVSLRFRIMENIMEIMKFIIPTFNTLKISQITIMEKLWKLWKIIICSFVGGLKYIL